MCEMFEVDASIASAGYWILLQRARAPALAHLVYEVLDTFYRLRDRRCITLLIQ